MVVPMHMAGVQEASLFQLVDSTHAGTLYLPLD